MNIRNSGRHRRTAAQGRILALILGAMEVLFFGCEAAQAQTSKNPAQSTSNNVPVARLQRQRDEKTEEIRAEREEMKPLLEFRAQLEGRKTTATKLSIKPAVTDALTRGKKLLDELAALHGKVNPRDDRIAQLQKIYEILPESFLNAIEGASTNLPRSTNPIISRITEALGTPPVENQVMVQQALEKLLMKLGVSEFDDSRPKAGVADLTWESARKDIEEARAELTAIESGLPKAVERYKTAVTDFYGNLSKALDAELDVRRAKIKSLENERDQLEQDLDKAGKKEDDLNTMLVYAVYGMVLAIVTLFLLLRFFPKDLARSIVAERTMIELLSMGFLLLTVIILGTGKLITGETLGALLGTIAGYIFGQKQGERRGATEERARMVNLMRGDVVEPPLEEPHQK